MEEKTLNDLQHPAWNPRRISEFDFNNLVRSMHEFGDLSGVVKNIATGHLVGGNQRLEAFKALGADRIVITHHTSETPGPQGTVAYGYIVLPNGEQFAYREVMWDEQTEKLANIAANRIQGEWEQDLLAEINQQLLEAGADISLTGQTEDEINALLKATGPDPEPSNDDGMKSLHLRFTDDQLDVIYQAIEKMKHDQTLTGEPNSDLDANALYYICSLYVQNATSQNIETPAEPELPADQPVSTAPADPTQLDQLPAA